MSAGRALFDPADVQGCGFKVDLIPAQIDQFGRSQAMPIGHEQHGGVPVAVAIALGRLSQPLDLMLGEIFAAPQLAVAAPLGGNCSF
jgi:hypothetical protein